MEDTQLERWLLQPWHSGAQVEEAAAETPPFSFILHRQGAEDVAPARDRRRCTGRRLKTLLTSSPSANLELWSSPDVGIAFVTRDEDDASVRPDETRPRWGSARMASVRADVEWSRPDRPSRSSAWMAIDRLATVWKRIVRVGALTEWRPSVMKGFDGLILKGMDKWGCPVLGPVASLFFENLGFYSDDFLKILSSWNFYPFWVFWQNEAKVSKPKASTRD